MIIPSIYIYTKQQKDLIFHTLSQTWLKFRCWDCWVWEVCLGTLQQLDQITVHSDFAVLQPIPFQSDRNLDGLKPCVHQSIISQVSRGGLSNQCHIHGSKGLEVLFFFPVVIEFIVCELIKTKKHLFNRHFLFLDSFGNLLQNRKERTPSDGWPVWSIMMTSGGIPNFGSDMLSFCMRSSSNWDSSCYIPCLMVNKITLCHPSILVCWSGFPCWVISLSPINQVD